ncbi:hypothetical protein [Paenibacillus planticolens]|uniref:DUF3168 domain-containing protein n=1 Tax=Paenibacillus planticolens TaxID=2654976 RepID=A0ABX1ZNV8_9BACL|nr:hypothetical protein [Paenibacillus planticolens]NOV01348.1 hypothetical protein [Paenibacillus planticolens]
MIDEILNAIQSTLQAEERLSSISKYNLVDGMIPGLKPTVSIGCGRIKYNDYDRDQDEATAPVRIYVYTHDMNAEKGEATIRNLAREIRFTLLENMYLGGLVDASSVTEITFESDQVNQGQLLHYAMIDYDVKYYESRQRSEKDAPPLVKTVEASFDKGEKIEIEL